METIILITKHSFDTMENEIGLAEYNEPVGWATSEEEAQNWIARQPQRTYKGWDKKEYPFFTTKPLPLLQ